jgi:hypothetical protein
VAFRLGMIVFRNTVMLVLDERYQVHVVVALDDEDTLTTVALGVRVFQNVEQITALNVEDDVLEPDAALFPEFRVLRLVPDEVLHRSQDSTTCACEAHSGIGQSVSKSVPKRGPRSVMRQPTIPTKPLKKRA